MNEEIHSPVTERFPDLSNFATIVHDDGTYLLAAGTLTDGLIVPLFPDELSAHEIIHSLRDDPRDLKLRVLPFGDPFKAMRKSAGEGAAGFQFSSELFTDEHREMVFKETDGRILFPFMTRREEAGGQWPTVLGSGLRCDTGTYLTLLGQARFGPHDLCQWVRWDIMDRASAKLGTEQPLRSHDPGEPFWCLSHEPDEVQFVEAGQRYRIQGRAVVLFAKDSVLRQFMPPEGYYPVFTSEEDAVEFLTYRMGGAFQIMQADPHPCPTFFQTKGLMAQDLGPGGSLIATLMRVGDLSSHLTEVRKTFQLPPYACFVLNPAGHRENVAWGRFADAGDNDLVLKSVGAKWKLLTGHQYSNLERIDQFNREDTFFLGPSEFRFAELRRTLGRFAPVLKEINLRGLTATEAGELIRDFIVRGAEGPTTGDVMGSPLELDTASDSTDSAGQLPNAKAYEPCLHRWVLNFWDTVDGERMEPSYFDTPFELARALYRLELDDRPARVLGMRGNSSIGFEGSGNQELENAGGVGFLTALIRICQRMAEYGYRPRDAMDMAAAANAVLESCRISLCTNVADALISHIPDDAHPSDRLMDGMGLPEEIREQLIEFIEAGTDPEGDNLLRGRIGDDAVARLPARTRLFLATALLQFDSIGKSPCIDYAPVSVQVVKALEFEMRELAAAAVSGFSPPADASTPSREEETLFHVLENRREMVTLGSITYAFKAAGKAQAGILQHMARQLEAFGLLDLTQRQTVRLIINDVLNRFRNGGAHEQAISYDTCMECIDTLVGSHALPGLILRVARWRRPQMT
jgi:hypothetical protein